MKLISKQEFWDEMCQPVLSDRYCRNCSYAEFLDTGKGVPICRECAGNVVGWGIKAQHPNTEWKWDGKTK